MIKPIKYFFEAFFVYLFFLIAKFIGLSLSRKFFSFIFKKIGPIIRSNNILNKNLFAFAGIGNPKNFFKLLIDNKLNIQKKLEFPDHYKFSKSEIERMSEESIKNNLQLITTEKDYFRIKDLGFNNIKFLRIKLKIFEKDKFINQILDFL